LSQFECQKRSYTLLNILIAIGLVYCNTPITDLMCALFGPYAAMFVNRIYPGKSLKASFVSPGKPWNLVFASPGKQLFTICTNPGDVISCWLEARYKWSS